MEKILSVLLVEDDLRTCHEIETYIDSQDGITFLGVTNDAKEALELVTTLLPDAVILDLELHQGCGNGLEFLQNLQQTDIPFRPYILITTNNTSAVTYECARQAGADFIMAKHQSGYSSKNAVDFLKMMRGAILSQKMCADPQHNTTESPDQKKKRIVRRICAELDNVGISPKSVGRRYLIDAIEIITEKPVSNLCTVIGTKYGKTDASVERAMQNAINRAWRTCDIDDLAQYYTARISSDKGVPTVTEFIYYYANKLRNEY